MGKVDFGLLQSTVGHARLWPKSNSFAYKVYYVRVPIFPDAPKAPRLFSLNRWNVFSIFTKDHGQKEQTVSWRAYISGELKKAGLPLRDDDHVDMICHPRVLGYAFNPITFWMVTDAAGGLRAVLCEVRNTFKQSHNYLLHKSDLSNISDTDVLVARKHLYVSPFNKIEGHYEFTFAYSVDSFKAVINYFDDTGRHILNTFMGGRFGELTASSIGAVLVKYPAMTAMVVVRIHWQALKLWLKRVGQTLSMKPRVYKNNTTTIGESKDTLSKS